MGVDAGERLDPLSSGALERELPVIRAAFDAEAMRAHLEAALIGTQAARTIRERNDPAIVGARYVERLRAVGVLD